MPEIARFYGIVVSMYYRDHAPPHIHARYAGAVAAIAIVSGEVIEGSIPDRALSLVREWAGIRGDELLEDWRRARAAVPLLPIEPLR